MEMRIYRPPQEDMTFSVAEDQVGQGICQMLGEVIKAIRAFDTVRTFGFHSLRG